MLEATIFTSTGVGVTIAFGSTRYFTANQNVGRVKSSVDDLTMERGTVSTFSLRTLNQIVTPKILIYPNRAQSNRQLASNFRGVSEEAFRECGLVDSFNSIELA